MYRIPSANMNMLQDKIDFLTKKALKLGVTPPSLAIHGTERVPVIDAPWDPTGRHEKATPSESDWVLGYNIYFNVEVSGAAPMLEGWKFIGTIHSEDKANLLLSVPGCSIPESYRMAPAWCDHCRIERFRKDTFIVQHEDGAIKQVGSSCIRDFLGHESPDGIASYMEYLNEMVRYASDEDGAFGNGGGGLDEEGLEYFLGHVAAMIRKYGWVSRSKSAQDFTSISTCERADQNIWDSQKRDPRAVPVTDEDKATVAAAIVWIRSSEESWRSGNDYRNNLYWACQNDAISSKAKGITASLISAYQKDLSEQAEKASKGITPSAHVGSIGEKIEWDLTLVGLHSYESMYGRGMLVRMTDEGGNAFVWFTATGTPYIGKSKDLAEIGVTYRVKGTVKEHSERQGEKQTVMTRCKFLAAVRLTEERVLMAA